MGEQLFADFFALYWKEILVVMAKDRVAEDMALLCHILMPPPTKALNPTIVKFNLTS